MHASISLKRRVAIALLLAILLSLSLASCERKKAHSFTFFGSFDTVTTVTVYGTDREAERFSERVGELLSHYHKLFDIYRDYPGQNNLKTLNDMAGIAPIELDGEILSLLAYGLWIDSLTDGACRITYGAVLSIWHRYREAGVAIPDPALLDKASLYTSPELLALDEAAGTAYLTSSEASLDVGAVAKGYATEAIARTLIAEGFSDFSLNVGGNLRLVGDRARTVGIRDPHSDSILLSFEMESGSLVTSGNYERFYTVGGVRYHHLIDPKTAMPSNRWASVSVLTEDAGLADALSTALFMLDFEAGLALLQRVGGAEALWVTPEGEILSSEGFPLN